MSDIPVLFDYDTFLDYYTNPANVMFDPNPPILNAYITVGHRIIKTTTVKSGNYIIAQGEKLFIDILKADPVRHKMKKPIIFTFPREVNGEWWDFHYHFGVRDDFTNKNRVLTSKDAVYFHKTVQLDSGKKMTNCYFLTDQDIRTIENIDCLENKPPRTMVSPDKFPITDADFPIIKEIIQRPFLAQLQAARPVTPPSVATSGLTITRKTINGGARKTRKIRYVITDYTRAQAKRLGVTIRPSTNPDKKLDVFKDGVKVASCGARGYNDYPTFWRKFGKKYADSRRRLYKQRHEKDRHVVGSAGYYADKLLW